MSYLRSRYFVWGMIAAMLGGLACSLVADGWVLFVSAVACGLISGRRARAAWRHEQQQRI